ncbi:hypothetical protein FGG08_004861, partial [Glutinoglossum americanum]
RKSPAISAADALQSELEGSPAARPPKDIYEVPTTPVRSKGRTNGVRSAKKQASPKTPKLVTQALPEPVPQISPQLEPAPQQAPNHETQNPQEPAPQQAPNHETQNPQELAPQRAPNHEMQSPQEPASQQAPSHEMQAPQEPVSQQAPNPEMQTPQGPTLRQASKHGSKAFVSPKKGPLMHLNYQLAFQIEKGDWVVRLRDLAAPKLSKDDIWDGPFQVQELPRSTSNPIEPSPGGSTDPPLVKLKLPPSSVASPWTPLTRLLPIHSIAEMPSRGVVHLTKDTSVFIDLGIKFKPKSRREKDMFTVGKIRGEKVEAGEVKYLVHWAEYPDEDDSWEGGGGIPDQFKEEWGTLHGKEKEVEGRAVAVEPSGVGGTSGSASAGEPAPVRGAKRAEAASPADGHGEGGGARKRRRSAKALAN